MIWQTVSRRVMIGLTVLPGQGYARGDLLR